MSIVRLELPAASLRLVTNVSPGKIVSAEICDFRGLNCGASSEAMIDTQYLHVRINNLGLLDSEYTITVSSHPGIAAITAIMLSCYAMVTANLRTLKMLNSRIDVFLLC